MKIESIWLKKEIPVNVLGKILHALQLLAISKNKKKSIKDSNKSTSGILKIAQNVIYLNWKKKSSNTPSCKFNYVF